MWIVKVAISRPYTFIVLALLILILSPVIISRTPTDIFPNINIPVIAVAWQFTGLNAEEMEGRFTTAYERILTTTVDNIEHIESTTVSGQAMIKIFLQPNASLDTANAQVTAVSQTYLRQLPTGAQPPLILNFSASTVPILQLALSGQGLSEQQLNDLGLNFLRPQLITVPGAAVPFPYGGKQAQVMVNLNNRLLQSKGLSPADIVTAFAQQNLVVPSGTMKIGEFEYDVDQNASPRTVAELNDLPITQVGNSTVYLRDVAQVSQGFAPQTNIVRHDSLRGVLMTILKTGSASTLAIVQGIRDLLPRVAATLPPNLKIQPLADQAIFVRAAVSGVIREAVIAACLTAVMILLFLGSWRSTLIIAVSIPLSILTSIMVLSFLGETINIMTLGGLALAVGILVDDATVEIENTNRNLDEGKELKQAILDGAQQIAVPALVSTLSICIVFAPMFLLSGVPRHLFVPLAEAVVFAMLASYFLSRTLVPTLAMYLLKTQHHGVVRSRNPLVRLVSLKENHHPTADYVRELRKNLPEEFPGTTFSFLPADMVTQILNFGVPAPVDIQLEGADIEGNRQVANQILNDLRQVPGLTDLRIQQPFDYPRFHVDIDRTKAAQGGYTPRDVAQSLLVSLSGSFQTTPTFFLNWDNGVKYNIATMTPQYAVQSLQDVQNIPISISTTAGAPTTTRQGILADVASITRANEMQVLSHYDILQRDPR